jgi:hypothetical protein
MIKTSGGSIATTGSGLTTVLVIGAGDGSLTFWTQEAATVNGAGSVYLGTKKLCDVAAGAFSLSIAANTNGETLAIQRSGTTNMSGWNAIWTDKA